MSTIDFGQIRSAPKSRRDSFEALAVHLFRGTHKPPPGTRFHALRGDGGDGGVEALFIDPAGEVTGVQAKYFFKLGSSELGQIDGSLTTALENHPRLTSYWVYVPFNLTGRKAKGKLGKSETERFQEWRSKRVQAQRRKGKTLTILLCDAQTMQAQIHALDTHGGLRRYWFSDSVLTRNQIVAGLEQSRQYAGPRYTAALDVRTEAHDALDFFGGTGDFAHWMAKSVQPLRAEARELMPRAEDTLSVLDSDERSKALSLQRELAAEFAALMEPDQLPAFAAGLKRLIDQLEPLAQKARELQERSFFDKHGEERDTPGFRQFMAEYQVDFPAAAMDSARKLCRLLSAVRELAADPAIGAVGARSFLLVGPAGIGKTHAIVSAAMRRLERGGFTLVVFGDDFGITEPWEVVRSKLGLGAGTGRDELFECLDACAANTGLPFLLAIDALNESPRTARWKDKLPELIEQVRPYPGIRVCVSTRDTYRTLVVDERFPGLAFEAPGFAGREFVALQAFAEHYSLDAEITPLFASELTNPLFLHLACQALKDEGRTTLDVSLPGFLSLFETHLRRVDANVRRAIGYRNPGNIVRAALLALADQIVANTANAASWDRCVERLKGVIGTELTPEALLEQLQHESMVILSDDGEDRWSVHLAYQRYGDLLRALSLIEGCTRDGALDLSTLRERLKGVTVQREGLLEALAVALPEKDRIEITDAALELDPVEAATCFVKGLLWRSRASISTLTISEVYKSLQTQGLWQEVFETFFKLALVPDHALNARNWLNQFLGHQDLVQKDQYLSYFAYKSFDSNGAVKSLLAAGLRADVSRWPEESGYLAAFALGWLCSCADRRVRDRATKALARLLSLRPAVAAHLATEFAENDDDYIKESVALGIYGAALVTKHAADAFLPALDRLLKPGYQDPPNALIRDHVRLLAHHVTAGSLDAKRRKALDTMFAPRPAPVDWPTAKTVQPLLDLERLPINMKLVGERLLPDFWRYQVEPRLRDFDLKAAGLTHENVGAWIMAEAMRMGYPGPREGALRYDGVIESEFGFGRGRGGHAERLGKKYYWVALHRLIPLLAGHLPLRAGWDGEVPTRDRLWSLDLRKMDPTDMRDVALPLTYPDEILDGPRYPFPRRDGDLRSWVRSAEFTRHEDCLLRFDNAGARWATLSLSASDDDLTDNEEALSTAYLRVDLFYTSHIAPAGLDRKEDVSLLQSLGNAQAPTTYRSYLGEYPYSAAFRESLLGRGGPGLESTEVSLLRGGEWEYEYASDEKAANLDVPAVSLVRQLALRWDGQRGWLDEDGGLAAFHSVGRERNGLFLRRDLLDRFLEQTGARLLYRRFASIMSITPHHDGPARDINTYIRVELHRAPTFLSEESDSVNDAE